MMTVEFLGAVMAAVVIIVLSVLLGMELPLYIGLTMLGVGLYFYKEDPILNYIGGYIMRTGLVLTVVAVVFYLFSGEPLIGEPFEFKFLRVFVTNFVNFWIWGANLIGDIIFSILP